MNYEITGIQLFDYSEQRQISEEDYEIVYSYSANLIINDKFVVQIWANERACGFDGVADPDVVFWKTIQEQEDAYNTVDNQELETVLEKNGFENNIGWIEDSPLTEVMNPENAQYRTPKE